MVHGPAYLRCTHRHQGTGKPSGTGVRPPAVGAWLEEWLAAKKRLRPGTVRSYEGHIRLYLAPCIGHVPLDRLRVTDVAAVFDYIDDLNDEVTAAPRHQRPCAARSGQGPPSGRPGDLPAGPGDPALGDRRLHEAASRRAARQRGRAGRTAAGIPAQGPGLDR